MKRALTAIVVVVGLSSVSTAFASISSTRSRAAYVPSVAAFMLSLQSVNPNEGSAKNAETLSASDGKVAMSIADVIGIALFLAVIAALFVLCRKGVFPETSCLCEPPAWLRRLFSKSRRRAGA